MNQIALPFNWPVADREEDFLLSECNRCAFDHLRRWALWPVMATIITGPRKSGRSLLGRIFVRKTDGRLFDNGENHDEEMLFHAWNEAQARRKPLIIIADAPPPRWQVTLPDLRSRLAATPIAEIGAPDDELISQLIIKLLGDRGIAAPYELGDYLVPRIERSYVAVQSVIDILDRVTLSHHKRMTIPLAKRALDEAGLLYRAKGRRLGSGPEEPDPS